MENHIDTDHRRLVLRGMARGAAAGSVQGPAPLGYRNVRYGSETGVEVRDQKTLEIIREAFGLAADGYSVRKILAHATARGLRSRHGKELTPASLHRILTNPFSAGMVSFDGRTVRGRHKALVNRDVFEDAQSALGSRCRNPGNAGEASRMLRRG